MRSLRIEDSIERELTEASLYITRRSRSIASEYITPVTLAIDEQIFLPQLH